MQSRVRIAVFVLTAVSILSLAYGYAASRVIGLLPEGPLRWLGWMLVALCLAALPLSFLARLSYEENRPGLEGLAWVAYVGLGLFSLLVTFFALRDALVGIWKVTAFFLPIVTAPTPENITWINAGVTGGAALLFVFGFYTARRDPLVRHVRVPVPGLHPDLVGFRILQISDVHIDATTKRPFIERVVRTLKSIDADMIAITGDLVDGPVAKLGRDAAPLEQLTDRPVFFVTGNHEYYSGATQWIQALRAMGIRVLMNEHEVLRRGQGKLIVAGITDITAHQMIPSHRSDPFKALENAVGDFRLMLAHQPRSVFPAAEAGADLVLSGHTHAGQYFPGTLIVRLVQPFVNGLSKFRDTFVYVNPGTGYWGPPLRLGTRSEITLLELAAV